MMKPNNLPVKRKEPQRQNPDNVQSNLKVKESDGIILSEHPIDSNFSSQKKTRDLPNLTECHACGFKVDVCSGKNGLQTLYSEWRIVLLCRKCFISIESSRICSYCLSETSDECFRCCQCNHSVHRKCFLKYKDYAPWSYACLGSEFSVCVDCWIPKSVLNSRRREIRSRQDRKKSRVSLEKGSSKLLAEGNSAKSLEDVVKDANSNVEKKMEAAARAREDAEKKAVLAKRAVQLANSALNLVTDRGENNENLEMNVSNAVDDGELAFELHFSLNSSPRISKNRCLLNSSDVGIPKMRSSSTSSSCKTSNSSDHSGSGKHVVSNDNKQYGDSDKYVFVPLVSVSALDHDSTTDVNNFSRNERDDIRTDLKDGDCRAEFEAEKEITNEPVKEGENSCADRPTNLGGEDSSMDVDKKQVDSALGREERCSGQPDRYFLKYRRRGHRLKPIPDSEPKTCDDRILLESQGSAAVVPPNCSGELRTLSDASCQSSHAPLQASGFKAVYSRKRS